MESAVSGNPTNPVLLIDPKSLRREAYAALLGPWAKGMKLELLGIDPSAYEASAAASLVIFSIGTASITDLRLQDQPIEIDKICGPVAVISDLDTPSEVIAAMALGVKGFLPTRLPAALALKTLTFILSGGDFFPASALRATATVNQPARRGWERKGQPREKTNGG